MAAWSLPGLSLCSGLLVWDTWGKEGARDSGQGAGDRQPRAGTGSHPNSPPHLGIWRAWLRMATVQGKPKPQGLFTHPAGMEERKDPEAWTLPKATPIAFLAEHPLFQILSMFGRGLADLGPAFCQVQAYSPHPAQIVGSCDHDPETPGGFLRVSPLSLCRIKCHCCSVLAPASSGLSSGLCLPTWATLCVLRSPRPALDSRAPSHLHRCSLTSQSSGGGMGAQHPALPWP